MTILDNFISAFVKLNTDDVNLQTEIDALKGQEQAFEASVQAQAEAAVTAALNNAGISPAQLQALTDRVTALEAADSALNNAATPPQSPPAPVTPSTLTITPATLSAAVGVASTDALTITGGVAPYTATGLPAGATFDGSNVDFDDTTVAGVSTVTISDSSTPALTATVSVTIS